MRWLLKDEIGILSNTWRRGTPTGLLALGVGVFLVYFLLRLAFFSPFTSFAYGPFPYPLQMKQLRYDTFPNSMLMGAGRRLDQSCGCITDRFVMGDRYQQ